MTKPQNAALVLAGLLLGCGAGAAATHQAVAQSASSSGPAGPMGPTGPAGPTGAARWQQYCEELRQNPQELNQVLAQRGAEGWELAAMPFSWTGSSFTGAICFKRPVSSARYAPSTL